jgi:hypothetical protein
VTQQLRTEDNFLGVIHHSFYQVLARVRNTCGEQSAVLTREQLSWFGLSELEVLDKRIKQVGLVIQGYDQAFAEEPSSKQKIRPSPTNNTKPTFGAAYLWAPAGTIAVCVFLEE